MTGSDGVIDPRDALGERYAQELAELRERLGEPRGLAGRWRLHRETRRLRRRIHGARRTAHW